MPELKLGSSGPEMGLFYDWATKKFTSYAFLLGKRDLYFGSDEKRFVEEMQRRLLADGKPVSAPGVFGDREASATGYKWNGTITPPPSRPHRPIWIWSAPGSGAPSNVGPPWLVGEDCRNILNLNHQTLDYPIGGYLGLMGGDPANSYNDIGVFLKNQLRNRIINCPDLNNPALEMWWVFYSQSADLGLQAIVEFFGDGGEFEHLRSRINGIICFGNPATQDTGIARKVFPAWVNRLTRNVNHDNDFYAVAKDHIRPLMYEWFIEADTEVPFVVYSAQVIIPALTGLLPGVGQLMEMPLSLLLSAIPGGQGGAKKAPNPELIKLLSVQGLLTSIPDLMGLIAALPGLQAHGMYDHRTGYDIVAGFRR